MSVYILVMLCIAAFGGLIESVKEIQKPDGTPMISFIFFAAFFIAMCGQIMIMMK